MHIPKHYYSQKLNFVILIVLSYTSGSLWEAEDCYWFPAQILGREYPSFIYCELTAKSSPHLAGLSFSFPIHLSLPLGEKGTQFSGDQKMGPKNIRNSRWVQEQTLSYPLLLALWKSSAFQSFSSYSVSTPERTCMRNPTALLRSGLFTF